jgi:hypothetical protein
MRAPPPILILAAPVQTGDLFGRLVADLFLAFGYDHAHLNIHKTGREIDIEAQHRTEPRSVRAECKATAKPIGGDDINKFAGALERERRRRPNEEIAGYFVSLAGFTETAKEQELEGGNPPRLTLLDGYQVITELIVGRIVVSRERALERAGRCAATTVPRLRADERPQLIAHEIGWIWAVRFRLHAEVTHLALIHADGEALSPTLAKKILDDDRDAGGELHVLKYLPPEAVADEEESRLTEVRNAYFAYLAAECGDLELEGLPADQDVGSRRLQLESLFVPLRLVRIVPTEKGKTAEGAPRPKTVQSGPQLVGEVLAAHPRLAILALPGGGKTTLIKRLAIAYAFRERRTALSDQLPDREWFPLLLRCRQFRGRAAEPVLHLLAQLGERAELGDLAAGFQSLVQATLREGRALLLVDGLDEISDPGERTAFVAQMRTFLSTYPTVDAVITSREAGFRPVASALAGLCSHYRIAGFDRDDVLQLTVAWHREVVGRRPEVEAQARELAEAIWESDRIRRLAVNPLLLTTLLLVKRWVGQLPNRRTVLYEKAIEVLLWTWNVQGYEQLDLQEVVPQLAFVAWQMMEDGIQRISQPRLRGCLKKARKQMPDVLAHASLSIDGFVERVEVRSSLLVLAGHDVEDGCLVPVYEFQHLTFQEFLAAKALIDGYYPDQTAEDSLASKLEPHFEDEIWKEVIPLASVLAGRRVAPLIEQLVRCIEDALFRNMSLAALVAQCLQDDVQIGPELLARALLSIARTNGADEVVYELASGKHRPLLYDLTWQALSVGSSELIALGSSLLCVELAGLGWGAPEAHLEREMLDRFTPTFLQRLELLLKSQSGRERASGLLMTMYVAYRSRATQGAGVDRAFLSKCMAPVTAAAHSLHLWEQFISTWALSWLLEAGIQPSEPLFVIQQLLHLIRTVEAHELHEFCAWALAFVSPPIVRPFFDVASAKVGHFASMRERLATTKWIGVWFVAFYLRQPWSDEELCQMILEHAPDRPLEGIDGANLRVALSQMGRPGAEVLKVFEKGT